jgi:hypothetical protein
MIFIAMLSNSASAFKEQSSTVRKGMWWKNAKMTVILTVTIIIILAAIISKLQYHTSLLINIECVITNSFFFSFNKFQPFLNFKEKSKNKIKEKEIFFFIIVINNYLFICI